MEFIKKPICIWYTMTFPSLLQILAILFVFTLNSENCLFLESYHSILLCVKHAYYTIWIPRGGLIGCSNSKHLWANQTFNKFLTQKTNWFPWPVWYWCAINKVSICVKIQVWLMFIMFQNRLRGLSRTDFVHIHLISSRSCASSSCRTIKSVWRHWTKKLNIYDTNGNTWQPPTFM